MSKLGTAKVLYSENYENEMLCVDIFQRTDESFGFEVYRRDIEANEGWFAIGNYSGLEFDTYENTVKHARHYIPWFKGG